MLWMRRVIQEFFNIIVNYFQMEKTAFILNYSNPCLWSSASIWMPCQAGVVEVKLGLSKECKWVLFVNFFVIIIFLLLLLSFSFFTIDSKYNVLECCFDTYISSILDVKNVYPSHFGFCSREHSFSSSFTEMYVLFCFFVFEF